MTTNQFLSIMSDSEDEDRYEWHKNSKIFDNIPKVVTGSTNGKDLKRSKKEGSQGSSSTDGQDGQDGQDEPLSLPYNERDIDQVSENGFVEDMFNNFVEVHPMCGAEFTSNEALDLLSKMPSKGKLPDVELVPRSYDNTMLRPANEDIGERSCVNGKRCWCYILGKQRHGEDDPRVFVCTEYLLPSEKKAWRDGKRRLPEARKKCLLCTRYFMHATMLRIKSDPTFHANMCGKQLQDFRNDVCKHAVGVESNDGYPQSRLLSIVDNTSDDPLLMYPVVGFNSKHYQFKIHEKTGKPYAMQIGMIPRTDLNGQPSSA